jgi:hypothetical protein
MLLDVLAKMKTNWQARQRPLNAVTGRALVHFSVVWILDGSALDAMLRKVDLLREREGNALAGRLGCLLNAASLLPEEVWCEVDSQAHDQNFWERASAKLPTGGLLLFDLGFINYTWFNALSEQVRYFVTRCKTNAVYQVDQILSSSAHAHDQLILLGSPQKRCQYRMRLVEIEFKGRWLRFLTNVLDPNMLSAVNVAALYQQRWRIEDAFNAAKRLLGLAYFYVGSINGVQVQVWATWLLYVVLVDLTDQIAEVLDRPFEDISMEMVFKGLYHFVQEKKLGRATDPVSFLALEAKFYGVIKHCNHPKRPLISLSDA